VFLGHASVIREGKWVDRASASMASLYVFSGMELADVLRSRGNQAEARGVFTTASQVAKAARLGNSAGAAESLFAAPPAGDSTAGVPLRVEKGAPPKVQSSEPAGKRRP
jgi:hypothetical protein